MRLERHVYAFNPGVPPHNLAQNNLQGYEAVGYEVMSLHTCITLK